MKSIDPGQVAAYAALLTTDTPERRLLADVPWALDAQLQPVPGLTAALLFESRRLAEATPETSFSIITPLHDTPPRYLEEVVACCRLQSWQRWELLLVDDGSTRREHLAIARRLAAADPRLRVLELPASLGISGARNAGIRQARGDYVAFLDHDDLLHPSALGLCATLVARAPDLDLIFSNEAKIEDTSRAVSEFLSKPDFDLFTLLRVNYVAHFMVLRRGALLALHAADGEFFRSRFDGVEDHDLVLRLGIHHRPKTAHLPHFLYYWRRSPSSTATSATAKPDLDLRGEQLRREHLTPVHGPDAFTVLAPSVARGNTRFSIKLKVPAGSPRPALTAIVPFRDEAAFTLRCLEALERQEHSLDMRVVLVDNGSTDEKTGPALAGWLATPRRNRYQLVRDDGAFNFARINNAAVRDHAQGSDLLLFLNNDVELHSPDCLETLAGHLLRDPACGFAGVRLLYPGGQVVQHGGVRVCESFGGSGYYGIGHARGREEFVGDEHVVLGVTFACAMARHSTFEALGGLEERAFPNGFGDVDICLRAIEAGLKNHYFGTLVGIHHEGLTRGLICEDAEFAALHDRHAATIGRWRLRQLAYDLQPRWVERTRDERPDETILPLRYRIADRLNYGLKLTLGRLHASLKVQLSRRSRARALRRADEASGAVRARLTPQAPPTHQASDDEGRARPPVSGV
jgi:GT2 family glycosyltransferase